MKNLCVFVMVAIPVLAILGCKENRGIDCDIRAGIKNFYTYEYFESYYNLFEEKEDIVTEENYAAFLEYTETFYEHKLGARIQTGATLFKRGLPSVNY